MLNYLKIDSLATDLRISLTFIRSRLYFLTLLLIFRLELLVTHFHNVQIHIIFQLLSFFANSLMLTLPVILPLLLSEMNLAPDQRLIEGFSEPIQGIGFFDHEAFGGWDLILAEFVLNV